MRNKNKLEVRIACPECHTTFEGSSTTRRGRKIVAELAHMFLAVHAPPCKFVKP